MNSERDDTLAAVALLEEPTRRRLYDWVVAQNRPVGREEAARAVGMTRALATFHLDRLASGGLLDAGYQRLTGRTGPGAGRPARVYWRGDRELSVSLPERRYERAAEVFAEALEHLGHGTPPPPLREAAESVGAEVGRRPRSRAPQRRLVTALEDGGYAPELGEDGSVRLRNCPFHALVERHRSLMCGTNLAMAEGIARGAQITELRPILDPRPGYCCVAFVPDPT